MRPGYDDGNWSQGPARLGYGDSVAETTISYGPDWKQKIPTTYFRHSFMVPEEVVFTNLNFRLSRQDGAVVYLNGVEMFRTNMPDGPISFTNRALKRVSGDPAYVFYPTNFAVTSLPKGTNVVAVELHINSPVIPSLGFDMELLGTGYVPGAPHVSVKTTTNGVQLSWPIAIGTSYSLYSSGNLSDPSGWAPQASLVETNANERVVTIIPDGQFRFYRLQKQ
jgi:hypothetical protein